MANQERMAQEQTVLLVQDTTGFDFRHHPATTGMGALDNKVCRGFFAPSGLAVSTDGVSSGVLEERGWGRLDSETGKAAKRHERTFEDKESAQWVAGLPTATQAADGPRLISVCDGESHIYEFWMKCATATTGYC